jgi:hypothetical protein
MSGLGRIVEAVIVAALPLPQARGDACPRCGWTPPAGPSVVVRNIDELERAVAAARPGETVLLEPGEYRLRRSLDITAANVTLRGRRGNPAEVVLRGGGMVNDAVGVAVSVSATGVTVADLTVRDVKYHAVQVRGESAASSFTLHRAHLLDTGQQLFKASTAGKARAADNGLVACSEIGYTTHAPSNYTNGVDLLATKGWTVRDNRILRIRGPESQRWAAGPAILVWLASEDTTVERNVIVDSFRGIALGLQAGSPEYARVAPGNYDHLGGVVRHNVIANTHLWADEGIEANAAPGARIEHNTVAVAGSLDWSIRIRFPGAPALVRNNLTTRRVLIDSGARATLEGNIDGARPDWFVNPATLDFHLSDAAIRAIDAGVVIDGVTLDFDRAPRRAGQAPDAGAFERRGGDR